MLRGADLYVDCLSVANRQTDLDTWEMWYPTNTPQVSYDTWVEVGMISGTLGSNSGFNWFWADNRPQDAYRFAGHVVGGAATGVTKNVSIYHTSGNDHAVYIGGNYVGTSTSNGSSALYANAGVETTTQNATVQGVVSNFQTRSGNTWTSQTPHVQSNDGGWTTTSAFGSTFRASSGCGARAAAMTTASMRSTTPSKSLLTAAQAVLPLVHSSQVDPAVSTVSTTRQAAAAALFGGDKVVGDGAVDVVQFTGAFEGGSLPAPIKSGEPPVGSLLTVVLDHATGQVTDWAVSGSTTSKVLSSLGIVRPIS